MSNPQYDEVGSRTRQSWLRTSLGVIVVTLLAERGLMVADQYGTLMFVALVPAAVALTVIVLRMRWLQAHDSDALPRRYGLLFAGALFALMALAASVVIIPSP
ncbi:MAG: hypothetical protein GC156_07940 [Actinomycetales bacterium]|nr:hypothetical protein [Actinomycetales bacterium]